MKYGDPLQTDINKMIRKEKQEEKQKENQKTAPLKKIRSGSREGQCKIDGCSNPIKAKQLCDKHYARKRRTNSYEITKHKIERGSFQSCMAIGCNKKHETYGFCSTHYKLYKELGTPYRTKIIRLCGIYKCDEPHFGKGLCKEHYYEWRKLSKSIPSLSNSIN